MPADPTVWNRSVPLVRDGDPVNAAITNAPTQVLADRTAALKSILDSLAAGEQLLLRDVPLSNGVAAGSVVYMRPDTLEQDLAVAVWQSIYSAGGRLFPADSAVFTGVVLSKSADRVGTVLLGGVGTLSSAAEAVLFNGVTPVTGDTYYLSMLNPGTVEKEDPSMSVRVLQYMGSGVIRVFPAQHEPVTHTHRKYSLLSTDWKLSVFFDPSLLPGGATYGIDFTTANAIAQNLAEAMLPAAGEGTFINLDNTVNSLTPGIHIPDSLVLLDENGIWWKGAAPDGDIELTIVSADTRDVSLLHTIESLSPESITITNVNGRVKVSFNDYTQETDVSGSSVVKDIDGHVLKKGPVVESVSVGTGLSIVSDVSGGKGNATLSLTVFDNVFTEANIVNLNNAVTDTQGGQVFTLLPENRASSVNMRATLPNIGTATYNLYIFAQFLSPDAGQDPPLVDEVYLQPTPDENGVTPVSVNPGPFPSFPGTVSAGDVYLLETIIPLDITGYSKGVISFRIGDDNPDKALRMVNAGYRLEIVP